MTGGREEGIREGDRRGREGASQRETRERERKREKEMCAFTPCTMYNYSIPLLKTITTRWKSENKGHRIINQEERVERMRSNHTN